jgi:hypothetical protein
MGYAVYRVGKRWGGYGVPAYCEEPDCKEEIDRGVSYACGGEPFSAWGCDKYFCGKHRHYSCPRDIRNEGEECDDECDEDHIELCLPCSKGEAGYPYKPEHPIWVKHILKDKSWAEWRKENPDEVARMKIPPEGEA